MAISPSQRYLEAYGMTGPQISPEMAWQQTERIRAGQDVLGGKYGTGLPQMLGVGPNGAAGGGGGGNLSQTYQSAADRANAANEARYAQGLGLLQKRQADLRDLFQRTSGGVFRELDRTHKRQIGRATANDAARGMFRSGAGYSKEEVYDRNEDVSRAEGEIAQRQALVDADASKDVVNFIQAKEDRGPDMNQMIGLEQKLGAGNTAGMYGGGGNPYSMPGSYEQPQPVAQGYGGYAANTMTQPRIPRAIENMSPQQYYAKFGKPMPGAPGIPGMYGGVGKGVLKPLEPAPAPARPVNLNPDWKKFLYAQR